MDSSGRKKLTAVFEKQWMHYAFLLLALALVHELFASDPSLREGAFLGFATLTWFAVGAGLAVGHHTYVWFVWRTEMHYSLITERLGTYAFAYYAVGFSAIAVLRVLAVFATSVANEGTLNASPVFLYGLTLVLALPMLYLFYSVVRYFGFKRAYGIDHFDQAYRTKPLVREGIYKYVDNGMYAFGTLVVILPGLIFASKAALLLGILNYIYAWVHYFALEKPDMKRIYGETR